MSLVEIEKKILRLLMKICLWTLVFLFATIAFVFIPSTTSLVSLAIAVIILPISKWQDMLRKALPKKWIKPVLAVALTIVLLASVPTPATTSQSAEIPEATENLMMPQTLAAIDKPTEALISAPPAMPNLTEPEDIVAVEPETQAEETSSFEIHFLDVGQADAAIVMCDGQVMLVDGGRPSNSSLLYTYLKDRGIDHLNYVVCTHPHEDHVGGLAGALHYASVDNALSPVDEYESEIFKSFVDCLDQQGVEISIPSPGDSFTLGSATMTVLGPIKPSASPNNNSIILRVVYGDTSFLLMGDAEEPEEADILDSGVELKSTLLKVAHHGSSTSSGDGFLEAVSPSYAVISDGKDASSFGRLTEETLSKLGVAGVVVYRTDLQGDIVCVSDGKALSFQVEKNPEIDTLAPIIAETPEPEATAVPEETQRPEETQAPTETQAPAETQVPVETPVPEEKTYILNTNTQKFHKPSCSSVKDIKDSNKAEFVGTRDEVIAMGYKSCGRCHP